MIVVGTGVLDCPGFNPLKNAKKGVSFRIPSFYLVRVMGLEPIRHKHTPLKRACLPIPAHSQTTCLLYSRKHCLSTLFLPKIKKILNIYFI